MEHAVKLRRDLASVPLRTGEETWDAMIELIGRLDMVPDIEAVFEAFA